MTFKDFVKKWSKQLSVACEKISEPRYKLDPTPWKKQLQLLQRTLIPSQVHAVCGVVTRLSEANDCIVSGENGVGKTICSASVAYLMGYQRVLVLCPTHIVKKWGREILNTLPPFSTSVHYISDISDLKYAVNLVKDSGKRHFFIMSKETARFSAPWRWSLHERISRKFIKNRIITSHVHYTCPTCGDILVKKPKANEIVSVREKITAEMLPNRQVKHYDISPTKCQAPLWQYTHLQSGRTKYSISQYIKKQLPKGYFDLFIADECHQFKGHDSNQGIAFGILAAKARKTLALTGTIFGGYSSTLFYLLYRLCQDVRKEFKHNAVKDWVEKYGFNEYTRKLNKEKKVTSSSREMPGIMPAIFNALISRTVFMNLHDLECFLPKYKEHTLGCKMSVEQATFYNNLENEVARRAQAVMLSPHLNKTQKHYAGLKYLHMLTTYPLLPGQAAVRHDKDGVDVKLQDGLPVSVVYPTEKKLIELVKREKQSGKKVLVYTPHTHLQNVAGRVVKVLTDAGFNSYHLPASIDAEKREEHIAKVVASGIDVMVSNPALVETGLDLLDFPTIVFYEPVYSIYTLRQASRRSWRIGQKKPVNVHFIYYTGTIHATAYSLIAKKMRASVMIDGEVVDPESLSGLEFDEDITAQVIDCLVRGVKMDTFEQELAAAQITVQKQNQIIGNIKAVPINLIAKNKTSVSLPDPAIQSLRVGEQMNFGF
ncbi:MAG: DEAD/DEAH box helicase [Caldisericia bacterium]